MTRLAFVVPVFRRYEVTRICLRQLRRTCDSLAEHGIQATAFVIGNDRNLDVARELDFGTGKRGNQQLGRKFNDGFQLACDPRYTATPADYVVPIGSDDWVDHRILFPLPRPDEIVCFRHLSIVSPDGKELTYRTADNPGGCGVRIYPRQVLARADYRPADEDRNKGCDTSAFFRLDARVTYRTIDPRQIVDWKSETTQIWPYNSVAWRGAREIHEPFRVLADVWPEAALQEMRTRFLATGSQDEAHTEAMSRERPSPPFLPRTSRDGQSVVRPSPSFAARGAD